VGLLLESCCLDYFDSIVIVGIGFVNYFIRARIAKQDVYVEEMNAKGNLTDEEWKEVWSAMLQTNRYLRAIGSPESEMYDI